MIAARVNVGRLSTATIRQSPVSVPSAFNRSNARKRLGKKQGFRISNHGQPSIGRVLIAENDRHQQPLLFPILISPFTLRRLRRSVRSEHIGWNLPLVCRVCHVGYGTSVCIRTLPMLLPGLVFRLKLVSDPRIRANKYIKFGSVRQNAIAPL